MFLFILKFSLNCNECMSLHGWFRATQLFSVPTLPMCCFWGVPWQIVCCRPEVPLVADHSLFMDEWDKFSLSLSLANHKDCSRVPFLCLSTNNTMEYHDFLILYGPAIPYFTRSRLFLWEGPKYFGMCFLCNMKVKIQFNSTNRATALCWPWRDATMNKTSSGLNEWGRQCTQHSRPRLWNRKGYGSGKEGETDSLRGPWFGEGFPEEDDTWTHLEKWVSGQDDSISFNQKRLLPWTSWHFTFLTGLTKDLLLYHYVSDKCILNNWGNKS